MRRAALELVIASLKVYVGAVCQLLARAGNYFLKVALGFIEFVLLHGPEAGFIVLHSLCKTRILGDSFLRGLLCHS